MNLLELQSRPEVEALVAQMRAKGEELRIDGQIIVYPAELWIDTFSGKTTARVRVSLTNRMQKRPRFYEEPEIFEWDETTFEVTP